MEAADPEARRMIVTKQAIEQVFLAPEISLKLFEFDRLRWYRSTTGRNGYFEAATQDTAKPARLQAQQVSRALANKTLSLRIDGTVRHSVTFEGPDPVSMAQVAAAIEIPNVLIAYGEGSLLLLETVATGSGASLEVFASDGAAYLGFLTGESAIGQDADNLLAPGVSEYRYPDQQSSPSAFYQVEFRNSLTGRVSARSAAFQSRLQDSVPLSHLIGCFIRLSDLQGRPLGGRRVYIHNVLMPNRIMADGKSWGLFRQYEEMVTDPNGYAEIFLVRGADVDVTVAGTGFTRRLKIPTTGTLVNLLDPTLEVRDEFGIQSPTIDFAIRTD
jgi:hypothetical protein